MSQLGAAVEQAGCPDLSLMLPSLDEPKVQQKPSSAINGASPNAFSVLLELISLTNSTLTPHASLGCRTVREFRSLLSARISGARG